MAGLDKELLSIFKMEAAAHLTKVNNLLLEVESGCPTTHSHFDAIKRELHTLKGSARMLGMKNISDAAHSLEDFFDELGNGSRAFHAESVTDLLARIDVIEGLIGEFSSEDDPVKKIEEPEKDILSAVGFDSAIEKSDQSLGDAIKVGDAGDVPDKNRSDMVVLNFEKVRSLLAFSNAFANYAVSFDGLYQRFVDLVEEDEHGSDRIRSQMERLVSDFKYELRFYNIAATQLQEDLSSMLLVPLSSVFDLFPRLVRDVAVSKNKEVVLSIRGKDIEIDKQLINEIKTMLLHILRNAVDHGIEPATERKNLGKSPHGKIELTAVAEGDRVKIEVRDDGRGLDLESIRKKAIENGLITPEEAAHLSEADAAHLIFSPGFSTSSQVTNFSGRGVGMDVVAKIMESYNSLVDLQWEKGKGTSISLSLPVNASVLSLTLFRIDRELYALPSLHIQSIIKISSDLLRVINGRLTFRFEDRLIPALSLGSLLGRSKKVKKDEKNVTIIVVKSLRGNIGLVICSVLMEKKMVVKQLTGLRNKMKIVSGMVSLASKSVIVLNPVVLFK